LPESQVEEIKSRLDISEFIRGYIKLEKSGANFRGLCPFHHEKTPSFFVSPSRQIWKCFGCSVGGDIFSFVEQIEGVEFKEALAILAERAGVVLRSFDPRARSEKSRLYDAMEKSCQFFEKQILQTHLGNEAKGYLLGRGLTEESIKNFRVGFSPASRDGLVQFLRSLGYSPTEILKTGLSIQPERNEYGTQNSQYDRFRGRIMFPICDINGQVIGFGGRVFFAKNQAVDDKLAKYINTPQTMLYDKSRVLYGLDKAKLHIREKDSVVIVEGYTDAIMSHQAGAKNVVAVSGTALTTQQLDLLKRYSDNAITCFDMDTAGNSATARGIDLALNKGFNLKVITFPGGKDPAEIIQADKSKWDKAVQSPISISDFYFETAFRRYSPSTPEGRKEILAMILPMVKSLASEIERSLWVEKLASALHCSDEAVWQDLKNFKSETHLRQIEKNTAGIAAPAAAKKTKRERLFERLLLSLLYDLKCVKNIKNNDVFMFDPNITTASIILKVRDHLKNGEAFVDGGNFAIVKDKKFVRLLTAEESETLSNTAFQEEVFSTLSDCGDFGEEFQMCLQTLRREDLRDKLVNIQNAMRQDPNSQELLNEFQKISSQLINE